MVRGGAGGGEEDEDVSVSVRNIMREDRRVDVSPAGGGAGGGGRGSSVWGEQEGEEHSLVVSQRISRSNSSPPR